MNITAKQSEPTDGTTQDDSHALQRYVSPPVNIFETADGYVLETEMPGVPREGLDISVEANTLTLLGRREPNELQAEALYRESTTADYRRVFELDPVIDTARIEAKLDQGVLTVRLPKSERAKPRKVTVND